MFKLKPGFYKTVSGATAEIVSQLSDDSWLGVLIDGSGARSEQTWSDGGKYFLDGRDSVLNLVDYDPHTTARAQFVKDHAEKLAEAIYDILNPRK